jgi:hypothetical protein
MMEAVSSSDNVGEIHWATSHHTALVTFSLTLPGTVLTRTPAQLVPKNPSYSKPCAEILATLMYVLLPFALVVLPLPAHAQTLAMHLFTSTVHQRSKGLSFA